jgi:hypothetical protein
MNWEDIKIGMLIRLIDNPANFYIGCNIGDVFKVKSKENNTFYTLDGITYDGTKVLCFNYEKLWEPCIRNLMDLKI